MLRLMLETPKPRPTASRDNPAQLVREAAHGSQSAQDLLIRRYLRPAYCVALSIVSRPADAEDVAQDSLIKALARIDTCRSPEAFEGWLMQIVRNHARNWRQRRNLRDVPGVEQSERADAADGDRSTDRDTTRRQLVDALAQLTETQRAVILLHDLEGYTHPEIAAALELSTVNSRQHLFVARQALREYVTKGSEP